MRQNDLKDKVLKGGKLAIQRMLEQKRKDNSFVVVSDKGKVVKLKAKDFPDSASANNRLGNM